MPDDVEEQIDITLIDPEKLDEEARKIREAQELLARKRALDSAQKAYAATPVGGLGQPALPDADRPALPSTITHHQTESDIPFQEAQRKMKGPMGGLPGHTRMRGADIGRLAPGAAPFEAPESHEAPDRRVPGTPAGPLSGLRHIPEAELRGVSYGQGIAFARDLVANPAAAIQTLFESESMIARGGLYAAAAAILAKVADHVLREYFKPGAPADVRKAVLDEARTIPQLAALIDVRAGRVLMSPEAEIAQFPPGVVSTDRLVDGVLRFEHLHEGLIL